MRIEFFFDFSCPFAYLGSLGVEDVADRTGAELIWRPMLLGGLFRSLGVVEGGLQVKKQHDYLDAARWAQLRGVPAPRLRPPDRTVRALRALLALGEAAWPALIHALYRAYWVREVSLDDADVIAGCLGEAGIDGAARDRALAANDDPAIKDRLRQCTDEAVARGVFGAPYLVIDTGKGAEPQGLWGQDRLVMAEALLSGWDPQAGSPPAELRRADWAETHLATGTDPGITMPPAVIEFWYDFSSPYSYLAATQIEALAARSGATLEWRPMLLGALFKEIGTANVPLLAMPEVKRRWMAADLALWAAWWNVKFRFASAFPQRTVTPLRLALLSGSRIGELSRALYQRIWVQDQNLEDESVLREVLAGCGFDPDQMLAGTRDPIIKQRLIDNTAEAASHGIFGAPAFRVRRGDSARLFWGQDRLDLVERAAQGQTLPNL